MADKITAMGTATVNGSIVSVLAGSGNWANRTKYIIVDAAGDVTGAFDCMNSNLAFLTPTLNYDANNVQQELVRNDSGLGRVTPFLWMLNMFN